MVNLSYFSKRFEDRNSSNPDYKETIEQNRRRYKFIFPKTLNISKEIFDDDSIVKGLTELQYSFAKISSLENSAYGKSIKLCAFPLIFGFDKNEQEIKNQMHKALTDPNWEIAFDEKIFEKVILDHQHTLETNPSETQQANKG